MMYRFLVGWLALCAPLAVSSAEPEVKVTELRDGIHMIEYKGGVIGLVRFVSGG